MIDQYPAPHATDDSPAWEITDVSDSFGPAGMGQTNRIKVVHYRTRNGQTSFVEVPFVKGWQDAAIRLIQAHAPDLDSLIGVTANTVS